MVLGSATWLDAIARNADLAYGVAHGPQGLFSQSWITPGGQGEFTAWEGVTPYDGCHVYFNFSAWVNVASGGYAKLQLYYSDAWHDLVSDTNAGAHWFDDAHDVNGVISNDVSGHYADGDMVRARLLVAGDGASAVTSAAVYRAVLGGASFEWPDSTPLTWPSWPTWTNASAHHASDFNTLRAAAEYLRRCAQRPAIATEKGFAEHTQGGSGDYQTLFRWSFRLGGQQELHLTLTTSGCQAPDDYVVVYIEDEQYPHGGSGASRLATLATYTSDGNQTLNANLSGYTVGTYYTIEVGRRRSTTNPAAEVTSCWLRDLAGVTRANTPGTFAYKDRPSASDLDRLADDLEDMKPAAGKGSPLWYEHTFATLRGMDQSGGYYNYPEHGWGIAHIHDYIYWVGAGQIVSADGENVETLSDSSPAGQVQVMEARRLVWLAKGDRYTGRDAGSHQLLTLFEHWEA